MKKWTVLISVFAAAMLLLAACSSQSYQQPQKQETPTTPPNNNDNNNNGNTNNNNYDYNNDGSSNQNNSASSLGLQVLQNASVGKYLADTKGITLYYFKKDKPGVSNCKDDCLVTWPAFAPNNLQIPQGMNQKDFGTITRPDTGQKQVTFQGYPLYYFINDKAQGDTNGQGINNVWFVIKAN